MTFKGKNTVRFVPLDDATMVAVPAIQAIRVEDDGSYAVITELAEYYFATARDMAHAFKRGKDVKFG